jgi:flagellar biosynthesis protein FlhF
MRLKLFRGAAMAEVMAQVRAELGPEALILNTRRIASGVEITAALEAESLPFPADPARVAALEWHGVPKEIRQPLARGDLEAAIAQVLSFDYLTFDDYERPVMLTGPPGAGKTLTVARLATRLVMNGRTPLVITTDGKRAGATEQLAAFTRLLGVPLLVANHPVSLARALMQRADGAPVLIDTSGADPRYPDQAEQIKGLAATTGALSALVLPAGLDPSEAADLAAAHVACGASHLIATRLDQVHRLGGIIAAAAASRLPLAEAGVGAGAADGLVPFTPSLLAARLSCIEGKSYAN